MPKNKQNRISKDIRQAKKAAVLNNKKRFKLSWALIPGIALLLVAGGVLYQSGLFVAEMPIANPDRSDHSQTDNLAYSTNLFDDGQAQYYEYKAGPHTIRYFILKSSDGVIRAAFDACDVCWPAGKGYTQQGDQMICRNCGRRFDSIRINEVKGGCNPAPLKRTLNGDRVIIQKANLLEGIQYFNFS